MDRVIERLLIENGLKEINKKFGKINWEYIAPDIDLIYEGNNFIFKCPKGIINFGFEEIWTWLYDEDYAGCIHDCDMCLTPIC
jgi:hypothetical protein